MVEREFVEGYQAPRRMDAQQAFRMFVAALCAWCLAGTWPLLAQVDPAERVVPVEPRPVPPAARTLEELAMAYMDPSADFVAERHAYVSTRGSDYVTARSADLFAKPDSGLVIGRLQRGDVVHLLNRKEGWSMVRTVDRRVGYVVGEALSNVWVLVSKSKHMIFVYRGTELVRKLPADFSINIVGDKVQRGSYARPGDWRTPEGIFYITRRNPASQFYRALVLSYPTPRHARQGLDLGLISKSEYAEILRTSARLEHPPQYTLLGGWIEFHGAGIQGKANWTHGCIALENDHMDELWEIVDVGTPVLVQPYKPRLYEQGPRRVSPRPIVERTREVPFEMLRSAQR